MAKAVHVKVVANSGGDKTRSFKTMLSLFKSQVKEAGIIPEFKRRQYFESTAQKKRRKKKESEARLQKDLFKENKKDFLG